MQLKPGYTYIFDQLAILDEQKKFYETIYQLKESDKDIPQGAGNFLKAELVTPLSLEDQKLCDRPITEAECLNVVKDFKKCKTPGTDGFSAEFYQFFWPELRTELLARFRFSVRFSVDQSTARNDLSYSKKEQR